MDILTTLLQPQQRLCKPFVNPLNLFNRETFLELLRDLGAGKDYVNMLIADTGGQQLFDRPWPWA